MDGIGNSFSFHLMAKPVGAICNLNCKYCFYKSKKGIISRYVTGMSDEVLEEYTNSILML